MKNLVQPSLEGLGVDEAWLTSEGTAAYTLGYVGAKLANSLATEKTMVTIDWVQERIGEAMQDAAEELLSDKLNLEQVRALAPAVEDQQRIINMGVQAYAFGVDEEQLYILCKIAACRRIDEEDLNALGRHFLFAGWHPVSD